MIHLKKNILEMGANCVTGETVPFLQRLEYDMTPIASNPCPIIWLVGPHCTGRHSHASSLAQKLDYDNILITDLLKNESLLETDRGRIIQNALKTPSQLVPDEIVIDLIKEAMLSTIYQKKGFILNGFPLTAKQANMFVKEVTDVDVIVFLHSDMHVLLNRIKKEYTNEDINELKKKVNKSLKEIKAAVSKHKDKIEKVCTDGPLGDAFGRIEAAVNLRINLKENIHVLRK